MRSKRGKEPADLARSEGALSDRGQVARYRPLRWRVRDRSASRRRNEDKALLDAAIGGDPEAIEELMRVAQPWLAPVVRSYFSDRDEAASCMDEFWVIYLFGRRKASLGRWDQRCSLRTWLCRLMGFFARHYWHRWNRQRAMSDLGLEMPEEPVSSPEGLIVLQIALERCKEELTPLMRQVFDLVQGGWEHEDISARLGKRKPAIAVYLHRARRLLIECIGR